MRLTIDGVPRLFTPIRSFRQQHDLPPEFAVDHFEPKDFSGLGRVDQAGAELNHLRTEVLAAIPPQLPLRAWLTFIPDLTRRFTDHLHAINPSVNLREVEIEFAAAGFANVCQAVVYALLGARDADPPSFESIYADWLDQTARVSQTVHAYGGWRIQIVTHAYGRAGLIVQTETETAYVQDAALGWPAEGFMAALLAEVAARIAAAPRP